MFAGYWSHARHKFVDVVKTQGKEKTKGTLAEQAICGFCIGKANWHRIDMVHGAQASAIIYSIVETSKANNLKPYKYFEHLLTEIPKHQDDANTDFLKELLSWLASLPEECKKLKSDEKTS